MTAVPDPKTEAYAPDPYVTTKTWRFDGDQAVGGAVGVINLIFGAEHVS